MLEKIDRSNCTVEADFFEKSGNLFLTPLRISFGKTIFIDNDYNIVSEEQYSLAMKVSCFVLSFVLLPVSVAATLIGVICTRLSETYSTAYKKTIGDINEIFNAVNLKNPNPEEVQKVKSLLTQENLSKVKTQQSNFVHTLIIKRNYILAKEFIEQNADITVKDENNFNPFETLLNNFCVSDTDDDKKTMKELVQAFIEKNCDINTKNSSGLTALHLACRYDYVELINYLIDKGADINLQSNANFSPLKYAISARLTYETAIAFINKATASGIKIDYESIIKFIDLRNNQNLLIKALIDNGMSPNQYDKFGDSLLCSACRSCDLDLVKFLISQGADINQTNDQGCSPLHGAVWGKNSTIVQYLVNAGADLNIRTKENNETALDMAKRFGCNEIVTIIEAKLENVNL